MSLINQYAANAYLGSERHKGALRIPELMAVYLIGSFLNGVHFVIFYMAPILLGSVGWNVGISYIALYLLVGIMTAGVGVLIAWGSFDRSALVKESGSNHPEIREGEQNHFTAILQTAWQQFRRMGLVFLPVTFVFALGMHHAKINQWVTAMDGFLSGMGLSGSVIIVVLAGVPSSISGLAAAGSLFQSNLLGPGEVVISLLIAYGMHMIYEFFTSSLPLNIAYFGPIWGVHVSILHLFTRLVSIALVLAFVL